MKKVLLVTRPISPPWDEGSKNSAYFIAKNVSDVEIHLMTVDTLPELASNVVQHNVYTTSEIKDFTLEQKLRSLFFQFRCRGKFDISHYFFTPTSLNSFLIKNFLTAKNTKTIQTIATLREDLWSDKDLKKLLFADLIITYSDYAKSKLESLGFSAQRIYPGIDLEKYQRSIKDEATLRHFDLTEKDFVIMYPGEYVRLGATDDIVATLPEIFKKVPNAKFMFACRIKNEKDRAKVSQIKETLREQNLIDKVILFEKTFEDMPKLYNIADIVVFPVKDMFGKFDVPLVVIEAMACEKPVIISDLPVLKEFSNDQNSVIIEKGNNEQLLAKIVELSQNLFLRDQIGRAARKYTEENFDIKKVAQKYEEVYDSLN